MPKLSSFHGRQNGHWLGANGAKFHEFSWIRGQNGHWLGVKYISNSQPKLSSIYSQIGCRNGQQLGHQNCLKRRKMCKDFVENPEPRAVPQQVSNSLIFNNHFGAKIKWGLWHWQINPCGFEFLDFHFSLLLLKTATPKSTSHLQWSQKIQNILLVFDKSGIFDWFYNLFRKDWEVSL